MKKLMALVLAFATILTLSACGAKTEKTGTESSKLETAQNAEKTTTADEKEDKTTQPAETTEESVADEPIESINVDAAFYHKIAAPLSTMNSFSMKCTVEGNTFNGVRNSYDFVGIADGSTPIKETFTCDVNETAAHIYGEFEDVSSGVKTPFEKYKTYSQQMYDVTMHMTETVNFSRQPVPENVVCKGATYETTDGAKEYMIPVVSTILNNNGSWETVSIKSADAMHLVAPQCETAYTPISPDKAYSPATCGGNKSRKVTITNMATFMANEFGAIPSLLTADELATASDESRYIYDYFLHNDPDEPLTRTEDGGYIMKTVVEDINDRYDTLIGYGLIQSDAVFDALYIRGAREFYNTDITYTFDKDYVLQSIEFDLADEDKGVNLHVTMDFEINNNPVINVPESTILPTAQYKTIDEWTAYMDKINASKKN